MTSTATGEAEILALIGKIVLQWNYAEHCSRQILRPHLTTGGSIHDADQIKLSKQNAKFVEDQLRIVVLPKWVGSPGEAWLGDLIAAFNSAREHRNYYVHGVYATHQPDPSQPAQASMFPKIQGVAQLPKFITAKDLWPIAKHVEELGMVANTVGNAFDRDGNGTAPTLQKLTPLPPIISAPV